MLPDSIGKEIDLVIHSDHPDPFHILGAHVSEAFA